MVEVEEISQSILDGQVVRAREATRAALEAKIPPGEILNQRLIPGIRKAGDLFGAGKYFLPELLMAGKAMKAAMEILEPELSKIKVEPVGRVAIGTVKGDLHDIGKNIVVMLLRANGWQVKDLGIDVTPEAFCTAVASGDHQILGLSSLLTTTMGVVKVTIDALKAAGLRDKVKIMVGGAPTTKEWAVKIGADGYADDAAGAVSLAEALVSRG